MPATKPTKTQQPDPQSARDDLKSLRTLLFKCSGYLVGTRIVSEEQVAAVKDAASYAIDKINGRF